MNWDKYVNKLPYPARFSKPRLKTNTPTKEELDEYTKAVEAYPSLMEAYNSQMKAYNDEAGRLMDMFWKDAYEELGIPENHPKLGKMNYYAYDKGHSGGVSEMFCALSTIWEYEQE